MFKTYIITNLVTGEVVSVDTGFGLRGAEAHATVAYHMTSYLIEEA